ncbi:MAG TPA: glycosyltransferase family 39 protein, partial [Acidimicrobiia bacterium]|nr:glycosyltransferase family 39 protein [Acidimicrobiia bacterium]
MTAAAENFWWAHHFHQGGPFQTDEAGELALTSTFTAAFQHQGLGGLWRAFAAPSTRAPLLALLGVPFNLLFGRRPAAALDELLILFVVLVVATYAVARRLVGPRLAVLAAALVGLIPDVTNWTRAYYTPLATTTFFAVGLACLLATDGLRRRPWAVAAGAAFGLSLLARVMALGLVPCAFVGAALMVVAGGRDGALRRLVTLVMTAVTTVAVAALWYARNLQMALSYLEVTRTHEPQRKLDGLERAFNLPLTFALLLTLTAGAAVAAPQVRARFETRHLTPRTRDVTVLVVIALAATAVFLAKANYANGEWLPVAILVMLIAVALWANIGPSLLRTGLAALLIAATAVNVLGSADLVAAVGRHRRLQVGSWNMSITDGRSFVQTRIDASGVPPGDPGYPRGNWRAWDPFNEHVAALVAQHAMAAGFVPTVFFVGSTGDLIFSPWSLSLADADRVHSGMFTGSLRPTDQVHPL